MDTQLNEPTNKDSIKVPKVVDVEPKHKKNFGDFLVSMKLKILLGIIIGRV